MDGYRVGKRCIFGNIIIVVFCADFDFIIKHIPTIHLYVIENTSKTKPNLYTTQAKRKRRKKIERTYPQITSKSGTIYHEKGGQFLFATGLVYGKNAIQLLLKHLPIDDNGDLYIGKMMYAYYSHPDNPLEIYGLCPSIVGEMAGNSTLMKTIKSVKMPGDRQHNTENKNKDKLLGLQGGSANSKHVHRRCIWCKKKF